MNDVSQSLESLKMKATLRFLLPMVISLPTSRMNCRIVFKSKESQVNHVSSQESEYVWQDQREEEDPKNRAVRTVEEH